MEPCISDRFTRESSLQVLGLSARPSLNIAFGCGFFPPTSAFEKVKKRRGGEWNPPEATHE